MFHAPDDGDDKLIKMTGEAPAPDRVWDIGFRHHHCRGHRHGGLVQAEGVAVHRR